MKVSAIRSRILAESDGLSIRGSASVVTAEATNVKAQVEGHGAYAPEPGEEPSNAPNRQPIREVASLTQQPIRTDHMLYAHEVSALNQQYVDRAELTRTKIETLTDRIKKGEAWLEDRRTEEGPSPGTRMVSIKKGEKLLDDLRTQLNAVLYENELPAEVLGFINALVHSTTSMKLRNIGAYVRVVIPDVLTFETDLVFEDIPF
jgi:hypothetical protein